MCLILFAWRLDPARPLVLAANRDEFHARPTLALHAWQDAPGVHAGRDGQAGGTWLGVAANGRFAALTNIRDPAQVPGARSRGERVSAFLAGRDTPQAYLADVAARRGDYAGFNLLVGDGARLWHFNSRRDQAQELGAGLYGLSNDDLDTPWPKVLRGKAGLARALDTPDASAPFAVLADRHRPPDDALPRTGVPLALERLLGSAFIVSPDYGTRSSTVLIAHANGARSLEERTFTPEGGLQATVRVELDA